MKIAVCIPAYNDAVGVMTAINSLRAFQLTRDVAYYVQDDASPDVLYSAVIPHGYAEVERNETNAGFGGNCNRAAARASGDVVLFVNQDVYAVPGYSEGWDAALMHAFERPNVGIVGARLLFPDGSLQSAGGEFDNRCQPIHRYLGARNLRFDAIAQAQQVEWATGAALAVRRDVFDALGGFSADYRMYFEDVDLCLRAAARGWETWYEPGVTLIHKVGGTGGSPYFMQSAATFHRTWVQSGKVKPGLATPAFRWW